MIAWLGINETDTNSFNLASFMRINRAVIVAAALCIVITPTALQILRKSGPEPRSQSGGQFRFDFVDNIEGLFAPGKYKITLRFEPGQEWVISKGKLSRTDGSVLGAADDPSKSGWSYVIEVNRDRTIKILDTPSGGTEIAEFFGDHLVIHEYARPGLLATIVNTLHIFPAIGVGFLVFFLRCGSWPDLDYPNGRNYTTFNGIAWASVTALN